MMEAPVFHFLLLYHEQHTTAKQQPLIYPLPQQISAATATIIPTTPLAMPVPAVSTTPPPSLQELRANIYAKTVCNH
ncbi:hypothetical protein Pmani_018781 [Petrolisthes manimaculis]|uniref:Uncharacterized protein n=1 Tax=Petrolisthes manimaculis TaxID=1843537 RepID=A0AAE1U4L2_9EUCA|nr:hypothetical protein Pmani_018781 [Petrolisthes manimaculis]